MSVDLEHVYELIEQHRDDAEQQARLHPDVRKAAGAAGLWVLGAPTEVGGLEFRLTDLLTVFERLGEADVTVGWHVINSGSSANVAPFLSEHARSRVFASTEKPFGNSIAIAAGVKVVPHAGGYRVTGTWPFMTGALDAEWAVVFAQAPPTEPGQPGQVNRMVIHVPDCEVTETWDAASAMRGTGSHAVRAENVFVPDDLAVPVDAKLRIDRPVFRVPFGYPFVGAAAAMSIGVLRSALTGVIEFCAHKISRVDGHPHFDDSSVRETVADAAAAADCLSASLLNNGAVIAEGFDGAGQPTDLQKARYWAAIFYTVETAADHVSDLYRIATSSAYATKNKVERALRDVHAINAAVASMRVLRRDAGGVLLGRPPSHPMF